MRKLLPDTVAMPRRKGLENVSSTLLRKPKRGHEAQQLNYQALHLNYAVGSYKAITWIKS